MATRSLKRRKLRKAKPKTNNESISAFVPVAPGDQMVVETLCTYSWVDVVWQVQIYISITTLLESFFYNIYFVRRTVARKRKYHRGTSIRFII